MKKILIVTMFVLFAVINVTVIANRNNDSNISLKSLFNVAHADWESYIDNYEWGNQYQSENVCGMKTVYGVRVRMWEVSCQSGTDECEAHSCF